MLEKKESQEGKVNASLSGRIILQGKLRLTSPLIIGGGSNLFGDSDIIVLKDGEGRPYIPSSSMTGALKHAFQDYQYTGSQSDYEWNVLWFWGGNYLLKKNEEKKLVSCQSSMMISDLLPDEKEKAKITVRDGIKIDRKTGVVEEGKKFDFEVIQPGISFDFKMEVVIRRGFNHNVFQLLTQWVGNQLSRGDFALGARTAQGFGRCKLENITYHEFDYQNKDHVIAWFSEEWSAAEKNVPDFNALNDFKSKDMFFSIKADFRIKNSLIIGAYPGDPDAPDKVHIECQNGDGSGPIAVIPGTSLRGTIRSRAEKIINTQGGNGEETLKNLFGWVDDKYKQKETIDPIKGRIIFEEKPITKDTYVKETQHRIRIDRFTGGVINNALFDSMPIWSKEGQGSMVRLELSIKNYKPWEAGLMMLVLKDLWSNDLAIGGEKNIGRGVLEGQQACISLHDSTIIHLRQNGDKLQLYKEGKYQDWDYEAAEELEQLVTAFLKHMDEISGCSEGEVTESDR